MQIQVTFELQTHDEAYAVMLPTVELGRQNQQRFHLNISLLFKQ